MTDYTKLVEALRCCGNEGCHKCPYQKHIYEKFCWVIAMKDAAAAIEDLQAQLPKRGKWELIDGAEPMRWGCSRCKYMSWETSTYCPRCGAKMEVQE